MLTYFHFSLFLLKGQPASLSGLADPNVGIFFLVLLAPGEAPCMYDCSVGSGSRRMCFWIPQAIIFFRVLLIVFGDWVSL